MLAGLAPLLRVRSATAAPRAVDDGGYVRIGGIDQWIAMRGGSREKPALLFLHGGPGEAQSYFWDLFEPWLADFIVIHWDQRGAGKTFARNGAATPDMSLQRIAADACEVADHARRVLAKPKVMLVGHSWGSMVALLAAKHRPELFDAVVGTGQAVNLARALEIQERLARADVSAAGDKAALAKLDNVAALPVGDERRASAVAPYLMKQSDLDYIGVQRRFVGTPPFPTTGPVSEFVGGARFSAKHLVPETYTFDARIVAAKMPVPTYVVEGRDDRITPCELAEAYVRVLDAPDKDFAAIDGGHFACFMNPDGCLDALSRWVRR